MGVDAGAVTSVVAVAWELLGVHSRAKRTPKGMLCRDLCVDNPGIFYRWG